MPSIDFLNKEIFQKCPQTFLKDLSTSHFIKNFLSQRKPVVIREGVQNWPAFNSWNNLSYFRNLQDLHEIPIEVYETPHVKFSVTNKKIVSFNKFWHKLLSTQEEDNTYYHSEGSIYLSPNKLGKLGILAKDIEIPSYIDPLFFEYSRLHFGKNTLTACHYHPQHDAFLCQIVGKKRVILFPPYRNEFSCLYPHPWYSKLSNWSQIDFTNENIYATYPNFLKVKPVECILEPGDMLFIPIYWWHLVYGENISISVSNFWKASRKDRYLTYLGLRSNYYWWFSKYLMKWAPMQK